MQVTPLDQQPKSKCGALSSQSLLGWVWEEPLKHFQFHPSSKFMTYNTIPGLQSKGLSQLVEGVNLLRGSNDYS